MVIDENNLFLLKFLF